MSNQDTSTDDYIKAIQYAKDNGHTINIDFSSLPKGVDAKALASAMGDGLSDDHNNALSGAADGGHSVTQDFSVTHPIINAVEKTAELGGMIGGGMAGASAGAVTAPVTGPVGAIAGSVLGGGLGYAGVKSGAEALNKTMGLDNKQPSFGEAAGDAVEGMKMQALGEGAGAVFGKGVDMAKSAYPYVAKLLTKLPLSVGKAFMDDPSIPSKYAGGEMDVSNAVKNVQQGLETLHDQASKIYSDTLVHLGLQGVENADDAATAMLDGETKSVDAKGIGQKWLEYKTNPNLNDNDKLKLLSEINQDINSHLKWAKAGQSVDPISNRLTPTLQTLKTGVKDELKNVPGGTQLHEADTMWHHFRQLYNSLQPNLKDTGEGAAWLKKVVSDSGTGSDTAKAQLALLDKTLGKPVADTAQKQIISSQLKQPIADSMLGKMAAVMAFVHPARAVTLPFVGAAQSPLVQSTAMRALIASQHAAHLLPEAGGAAMEAGKQTYTAMDEAIKKDSELNEDDLFTK